MTNKYRFYLDGVLVHPFFGDGQSKDSDLFEDQVFHRDTFAESFSLIGDEYTVPRNSDLEHEFSLAVERLVDPSVPTWEPYYQGYFTKFDAEVWDDDNKIVRFKVLPDDKYRKLIEGWDKEINIIDLGIDKTAISYVRYPILQMYVAGFNSARLINYSKGNVWESELEFRPSDTELTDEGFVLHADSKETPSTLISDIYLFCDETAYPTVFGRYVYDSTGTIGGGVNYDLYVKFGGGGTHEIRFFDVNGNYLVNESGTTTTLMIGAEPFGGDVGDGVGNVLQMKYVVDDSIIGHLIKYRVYTRFVCDLETVGAISTTVIPNNAIVSSYGRKRYVADYVLLPGSIIANNVPSVTDEGYGQIQEPAIQYLGDYYVSGGLTARWPIAKPFWRELSIWAYVSSTTEAELDEANETIVMPDGYRLDKVLKAMIQSLDPTLDHQNNAFFSSFLYSPTNPLSFTAQSPLYITAKSNITKPNYDKGATQVLVKLKELLRALRIMFWGLKFDIVDNRLRIEHDYFYEQGGTYGSSPLVGINLNTLIEAHVNKPWGYYQNKFKYEKAQIPGRINPSWSEEVSNVFKGQAVEINSVQAEKERSDEESVPLVITDINYINDNPTLVSNSGLVMMEVGTDGFVVNSLLYNSDIQDDVPIQNGNLSFTALAAKFAKHQAPATDITVNGSPVTAVSVIRQKVQEVEIVLSADFDKTKLVRTEVGKGKIFKAKHFLNSDNNMLTLKHRNE